MSSTDIRNVQPGQSDQEQVVIEDDSSQKLGGVQMRIWHQLLACDHTSELGQISTAPLSLSPRNRFEYVSDREQNPRMTNLQRSSFVVPAMIKSGSKRVSWFGSPDLPCIGSATKLTRAAVEEFHLTRLLNEIRAQLVANFGEENLLLYRPTRMPNLHLRTSRKRHSQKNIAAYAVSPYVAVAVAQPEPSYGSHFVIDRVFNANNYKRGVQNKQTVEVDRLNELKLDSFAIAVNAPGFDESGDQVKPFGWLSKRKGGARPLHSIEGDDFLWSSQMLTFINTGAPVPWISMDQHRYVELWDEVLYAEESRKPTLFIVEGTPKRD